MDDSRLTYSVNEAAEALGLGRNSTYAAIRRGEIPAIRIGRRLFVSKAALERLVNGQVVSGADDPAQV